jgi:hypothetical protein
VAGLLPFGSPDMTGAFSSVRREFLPRRLGFTHKRMTKIDATPVTLAALKPATGTTQVTQ